MILLPFAIIKYLVCVNFTMRHEPSWHFRLVLAKQLIIFNKPWEHITSPGSNVNYTSNPRKCKFPLLQNYNPVMCYAGVKPQLIPCWLLSKPYHMHYQWRYKNKVYQKKRRLAGEKKFLPSVTKMNLGSAAMLHTQRYRMTYLFCHMHVVLGSYITTLIYK